MILFFNLFLAGYRADAANPYFNALNITNICLYPHGVIAEGNGMPVTMNITVGDQITFSYSANGCPSFGGS
ncbi:MAG TPA: hypothetical protein VI757_04090, partial [Bacteroidia bacterium]|nr:hypothetical protein [Bacteroidia bacterium]